MKILAPFFALTAFVLSAAAAFSGPCHSACCTKCILIPGPEGPPGKNGKDGLNGINGKNGRDGKDGLNGKDGKDGKDGVDGKNGKNGKNGKDGRDGRDGKEGKDGARGPQGPPGTTQYIYVPVYVRPSPPPAAYCPPWAPDPAFYPGYDVRHDYSNFLPH